MDARQLRYFVAVAEELSFSRAAERLHMSQPPLSVQIKAMEESLDTRLFDRSRHGVALTASGQLLLAHARTILRDLDHADRMVRLAGRGEAGTIRMGFIGSLPMLELFSFLVGGYRTHFPNIRIDLLHRSSAWQVTALLDGEIDVGFVRPSRRLLSATGLTSAVVWSDRLKLFFPSDHHLAGEDGPVDLAALAGEPFVGVARSVGCGVYDLSASMFARAGVQPDIVQEANDLRTLLWLVASRTGIALLPECYDRAGIARVASRPIRPEHERSDVCMVTRAEPGATLTRRFVDYAKTFPRPLE